MNAGPTPAALEQHAAPQDRWILQTGDDDTNGLVVTADHTALAEKLAALGITSSVDRFYKSDTVSYVTLTGPDGAQLQLRCPNPGEAGLPSTPADAGEDVVTDYASLLNVLRCDDNARAVAAYDTLKAALGACEAGALWDKACREIDHEAEVARTVKELADALGTAASAIRAVRRTLDRLTDPHSAWHPDYAEGDTGADLRQLLDAAAFNVRLANAVNHTLCANDNGGAR